MGSEISLACLGKGDNVETLRDSDGIVGMARHQDYRRSDLFGSCTHVSVSATEAFFFVYYEDTLGEERRAAER